MPDVFTRMHAASVIETLGAGLILIGLILQAGFTLVAVKLRDGRPPDLLRQPDRDPRAGAGGLGARTCAALVRRGGPAIETLIINALLTMMAIAVVVIARSRNLFGVIVLGGLYSFLMATVLVAMDAVDVAMTEASVGAGISTVLLLGALHLCRSEESKPCARPVAGAGRLDRGRRGAGLRHARACRRSRIRHRRSMPMSCRATSTR